MGAAARSAAQVFEAGHFERQQLLLAAVACAASGRVQISLAQAPADERRFSVPVQELREGAMTEAHIDVDTHGAQLLALLLPTCKQLVSLTLTGGAGSGSDGKFHPNISAICTASSAKGVGSPLRDFPSAFLFLCQHTDPTQSYWVFHIEKDRT